MHPDDEKVLSRIDATIDGLTADRDRLRDECERLRKALVTIREQEIDGYKARCVAIDALAKSKEAQS